MSILWGEFGRVNDPDCCKMEKAYALDYFRRIRTGVNPSGFHRAGVGRFAYSAQDIKGLRLNSGMVVSVA